MKNSENMSEALEKRASETPEPTRDKPVFTPAADIYETPDRIVVVCDMPGVDEKNVDVSLADDTLTLVGERTFAGPEGAPVARREFREGVFRRAFTILTSVDANKITAKMTNGALTIELPKAEKAKPQKIKING